MRSHTAVSRGSRPASSEPLEITLEDAQCVRLRPEAAGRPDVHGPYAFRVRDERGLLLRDDTGPLRWSEGFSSEGFELLLVAGGYAVDVLCEQTFSKTVDLTVTNAASPMAVRVEVTARD